jgi:hypothetical protein
MYRERLSAAGASREDLAAGPPGFAHRHNSNPMPAEEAQFLKGLCPAPREKLVRKIQQRRIRLIANERQITNSARIQTNVAHARALSARYHLSSAERLAPSRFSTSFRAGSEAMPSCESSVSRQPLSSCPSILAAGEDCFRQACSPVRSPWSPRLWRLTRYHERRFCAGAAGSYP